MDNLRLLLSAIAVVLLAVISSPSLHKFLPLNQLSLRGGEVADLVVVNGTIYTSDAAFPFADSMAIRGGRILRVGNSSSMQVADINPLGSIKTAVKRVPPGWTEAWIPSERISLSDALNGYTISAASSCFLDEDIGSLSPGKMADFVVLSVDSWDKFAAEASASVEATYVGGSQAYSKSLNKDL
ncbi:UNVERIFIED_CONTAM: protein LONG AFTER FAR-RED 3 [Sesamum radiatum]|uniref:Protein LONG AFTER FAR-RED 3 n=1 Tax=Sesamum radiatum TaxID=300843 RepID=A0AAW2S6U3_SESRA